MYERSFLYGNVILRQNDFHYEGGNMTETINWSDKYKLSLKETMSIKDIMRLRSCGQPKATAIRNKAVDYCKKNSIEYYPRSIPTIAIFAVTKLDTDYYYQKMIDESRCI